MMNDDDDDEHHNYDEEEDSIEPWVFFLSKLYLPEMLMLFWTHIFHDI